MSAPSTTTQQSWKVGAFAVKWIDNPDFQINLARTVPAIFNTVVQTSAEAKGAWTPGNYQPLAQGIPESSKKLADAYFAELLRLHRDLSANYLTTALKSKGVKEGGEMIISITPVSGYQSIDGWGTNMVLRTEFTSSVSSKTRIVDVMIESGIHWTGVANASKPTAAFVDQYISNLMSALRDAKAF